MRLVAALFAAVLAFKVSLAEEPVPFSGQITEDNINIRADATVNSAIIATVNKGDQLEIVSEFCEWYKIRLPKNALSYIKKDMVSLPGHQSTSQVLKNRVNIRSGPNEASSIVGAVDKNEVVNINGEAGGWYKIEPAHNSFGWVHKKFVDEAPQDKIQGLTERNTEAATFSWPRMYKIPPQETANTKPPPRIEQAQAEKKDAEPEPLQENIVLKGVIKPCGRILGQPATHKLITPEKKIFFLKGNKKELDALNYRRVKVTGKISAPSKQKYPSVEVKILEVTEPS